MLPKRPPRSSHAIAILTLALVAAACASRPLSGVAIKNLTSDLVFGIPPLPEAVGPANTLPLGLSRILGGDEGNFGVFKRRSHEVEADPCPVAPVGAAPSDSVPQTISSSPRTGVYKYRYSVALPKTGLVFEGFEKRAIGNLRGSGEVNQNDPEAARFDFTFTVSQELAGTDVQILQSTTFGVDQSSQSVNPTGPSVFKGQNPKGIFLLRTERSENIKGQLKVSKFEANPAIKYITLPGIIGAEGAFSTTSVDPTTQAVITHEGETIQRQPVDACGEMIDSWFVDAKQTFTAPDGTTYVTNMQYGIATQLGGMIVLEHFEVPSGDPDRVLDFAIGSIAPK